MEIHTLKSAQKRLIIAIGRHQTEENPLTMTELGKAVGDNLANIQGGHERIIDSGLIDKRKNHPKVFLHLTDKGEELYEALETEQQLLEDL